jgi:uncharacterized membrane protein YtjA (UPF0391 family)
MLKLALLFFIIALAAGSVGYTGLAASSIRIVEIVFWGALALCVLSLVVSLFRRDKKRRLYY